MDSGISPSLPLDLERDIFEIAANRHPQTIPILLLVAQRVLKWYCIPLLYRTLVFIDHESPRDSTTFCPESAKLAKYVQNMLIWATPRRVDFALRVLSSCSGIRKLMLFGPYLITLPALEKMQLRQLNVDLRGLFGDSAIDPARPLFRALTHLHLLDYPEGLNVAELPALTHLCLPHYPELGFFSATLANCRRLCVLVNIFWTRPGVHRISKLDSPIDDLRFVLMSYSFTETIDDWKLGTAGGRDFWIHSENLVSRRRRGEIEPGMSCLTRRNTSLIILASFLASRFWIKRSDLIG
ncbi:hypothetical protein C8J57DRAFT_1655020 [Mycena rebaudengoi]|nr:hypothetical protein C8J57DRAFT_1655020 [Mycena rebaudengoi]